MRDAPFFLSNPYENELKKHFRAARAAFIIWWKREGDDLAKIADFQSAKLSLVCHYIYFFRAARVAFIIWWKNRGTIWRTLPIFRAGIWVWLAILDNLFRAARAAFIWSRNGGTFWRKLAIFNAGNWVWLTILHKILNNPEEKYVRWSIISWGWCWGNWQFSNRETTFTW